MQEQEEKSVVVDAVDSTVDNISDIWKSQPYQLVMHRGKMHNAGSPRPPGMSCGGGRRRAAMNNENNLPSCFRGKTQARSEHPVHAIPSCSTSCSTLPASNVTPQKRIMVRHGVGIVGCYTPGCSVVAESRSAERSTPSDPRRAAQHSKTRSHRRSRSKGTVDNKNAKQQQVKTPLSTPPTNLDIYSSPDQQKAAADICGVISVMRSYPHDTDTQILGCDELRMYSKDPDNAVAIAVAGGIRTIVAAMEAHSDSVSVVSYGTECLHNLAKKKCHRHFILKQGGLRVLVAAISTHSDSFVVRSVGCEVLSKILTGKEDRKVFDESGGLQAMMKLLSSFSSDEKVICGTYKVLKKVGYDPNWELFIWNDTTSNGIDDTEHSRKVTEKEETNHDTTDCTKTKREENLDSPSRRSMHVTIGEEIVSPRSSRDQRKEEEGKELVLNTADFILSPTSPREDTSSAGRSSPIQATVGPKQMLALMNAYPEDETVLRLTFLTLKDCGYDPAKVLDSWGLGQRGEDVPLAAPVSPTSTTTSSSSYRSQKSEDSTPSPFDKNAYIEDELDFRNFISLTSKLETSYTAGNKTPQRQCAVQAAPGA